MLCYYWKNVDSVLFFVKKNPLTLSIGLSVALFHFAFHKYYCQLNGMFIEWKLFDRNAVGRLVVSSIFSLIFTYFTVLFVKLVRSYCSSSHYLSVLFLFALIYRCVCMLFSLCLSTELTFVDYCVSVCFSVNMKIFGSSCWCCCSCSSSVTFLRFYFCVFVGVPQWREVRGKML